MKKDYRLIELDIEQKEKAIEFIASFFDCCRYETCIKGIYKQTMFKDFDSKSVIVDGGKSSFYDSMSFYVLSRLRCQFFDDTFPSIVMPKDKPDDQNEIINTLNSLEILSDQVEYFIDFDEVVEMIGDFTIEQLMLLGDTLNTQASIEFHNFLAENMNLVKEG